MDNQVFQPFIRSNGALRIAFISSYVPRRCGIATYTKDLANGINSLNPECLAEIIALDDGISEGLEYPWEVSRRIRQNEWADYEKVIEYINTSVIDVVSLQHEFGLYGGEFGEMAVEFVKQLNKPVVVTCHSVLKEPFPQQRRILQSLGKYASKIVVMLESSRDVLSEVYNIPKDKIVAIHHGAPDLAFEPASVAKKELKLEDKIVMSSINLLGRGRGIEYALEALPAVVKKYPNFLYMVIGQTHPGVIQHEGEAYRDSLEAIVKKHKLEKNVQFVNRYVSLEELVDFVRASDLYVTPYENMETASSGSLAYAIAGGKVCISTPFKYAQEMFAGNRGVLVPPRDPQGIAQAILHMLDNPDQAEVIRQKCYLEGRKMTWPRVGYRYLQIMRPAVEDRGETTLEEPTLAYLHLMTDEHGLLEHSACDIKNHHEGYATDDVARGLIVAIAHRDNGLAKRYLDFLISAEKNGQVYCDKNSDGTWIANPGLGDWFGRTFWAAAYAVRFAPTVVLRRKASDLVKKLLPSVTNILSYHTLAYILLGLTHLKELEWDEASELRLAAYTHAVSFIKGQLAEHRTTTWFWLDTHVTYDNPRVAEAFICAGTAFGDPEVTGLGLQMLQFILDKTYDINQRHFRFIGNEGWLARDGVKPEFDEQPIEAGATAAACVAAFHVTGLNYYRDMAYKSLAWFLGENIHRRPLWNAQRQASYDGITRGGVNLNQGAESTLEYLLAYMRCATLVKRDLARDIAATT